MAVVNPLPSSTILYPDIGAHIMSTFINAYLILAGIMTIVAAPVLTMVSP